MKTRSLRPCVLDASMGCRDGLFSFCEVRGDLDGEFEVMTGLTYVGARVPDGLRLVAIVHPGGQDAAEAFCIEHAEAIAALDAGEAA